MALRNFIRVVYLLKPPRFGTPPFSDVRLPGGTVLRQVDTTIHQTALARAAKILRRRLDP